LDVSGIAIAFLTDKVFRPSPKISLQKNAGLFIQKLTRHSRNQAKKKFVKRKANGRRKNQMKFKGIFEKRTLSLAFTSLQFSPRNHEAGPFD